MIVANKNIHSSTIEPAHRNRFTKAEDERLKQLLTIRNPPNWNEIAHYMNNRTSRQCRERYNNYLRPNIINGQWTKEEDDLLNQLYEKFGPKWSLISQSFTSRSAVNIKNHHSTLVSQANIKNRQNYNVINEKSVQPQILVPQEAAAPISTSDQNTPFFGNTNQFLDKDIKLQEELNNKVCDDMFSNLHFDDEELWYSSVSMMEKDKLTTF